MQNHHKIWEVGLPFRYLAEFPTFLSSWLILRKDGSTSEFSGCRTKCQQCVMGCKKKNRCTLSCETEGAGILDVIPEGLSASLLQHVLGSKCWRNGQGDSSRVSSRGSDLAQILQTSSSQCESFFFFFLSFFCLHESAGRMSLSPISFPAGSPKCNDEPAVGAAGLFWKDSEDSIVMEVLEVRQQ